VRVSCVVSFGVEVFLCDACDVEVHGANAVRRRKLTRAVSSAENRSEATRGDRRGRAWVMGGCERTRREVSIDRARCERGTRERRD
jgi:hypothetical protein